MAEPWKKSFGRYLKILRVRTGHSLDDVCSLSQTFPDRIHKSYLSRCENGIQPLSFPKLIPLSRIYNVPSEVLVERMELDMELDRVGGPDTEGRCYQELTEAGKTAIDDGRRWDSYGLLRDAIQRALVDPIKSFFASPTEQLHIAYMSCATAAAALGRDRFSLFEYQYILSADTLSPKYAILAIDFVAQCHRRMNDLELARQTADRALRLAEDLGDLYCLAYIQSDHAVLACCEGDPALAVRRNHQAFRNYRRCGLDNECARVLNNLAQAYFDQKRYGASRRTIAAAERFIHAKNQRRPLALGRILLGEIEALEHRNQIAERHWRQALQIGKELNDKVLKFKAQFFLFKLAHEEGNAAAARALHRRLTKLSPWLPNSVPELVAFRCY